MIRCLGRYVPSRCSSFTKSIYAVALPRNRGYCDRQRRLLSSSSSRHESPAASAVTTATTTTDVASGGGGIGNNSAILQSLPFARHGPGDAVIKLNVGGKEFVTLRSTVESNAVLSDYIRRAEANGENLDGGSAVFIDRDPTHFGLILAFLRNRIEGIAYNSKYDKLGVHVYLHKKPKYVRLPKDEHVLEDLFVEATHYRIKELQHQLCEASLMTMLFSQFGGGNPFAQASSFFKQFRRTGVALVGSGSIITAFQQDVDWLHNLLPWLKKKDEKDKSSDVKQSSNKDEAQPAVAS